MPQYGGRTILGVLLAGLLLRCCAGSGTAESPTCRPQGLLQLDKPYPPPYRVRLPFCDKYECSCCNASHALTIQRAVRPILLDDELSQACRVGLVMMACSICDPEVGVGKKPMVCQYTCQRLFKDCSQDYFSYDDSTGLVSPCTSQSGVHVVCSQLTEVVQDGTAFCQALGQTTATTEDQSSCFSGEPVGPQGCSNSPPQATQGTRQHKHTRKPSPVVLDSWSLSRFATLDFWPLTQLSRRHRRQLRHWGQLLLAGVVTGSVAAAVMLGLRVLMKPNPGPHHRDVHSVRDVLAKAAEARTARAPASAAVTSASSVSRPAVRRKG